MACAYPECNNILYITTQQKRELKTFDYLKYGVSSDLYCSKHCQEKHLRELSEAEFVQKGALKNREYCLRIHDVDVTKRPKEREVTLITGTITEQRARCLQEKLKSTSTRMLTTRNSKQIKKYLTSNEVKSFLLEDISDSLKPPKSAVLVAAYDTMNKTVELFPDHICIGYYKDKSRYIEYIN